MTAERESMTLQEMDAPALGVEERRDEAPRAGASHARPTPDPEVVAKPKRRKFTAQYRLRILEEAESCTQPGEVGRLLRREGLYSSHLTEWRRARREGSLQGLTPSKRGRKPAERNPLSAKVHELEAKVARLQKELHTAHTILDVQVKDSLPGGWRFSHPARRRSSDGRYRAARDRRSRIVAPAFPSAGRATGFILPTTEDLFAVAFEHPRPTPGGGTACVGNHADVHDVLASSRFDDRSIDRGTVATQLDERRYPCVRGHDGTGSWPLSSRCESVRNQSSHPAATPSPKWRPRAATRPGPRTSRRLRRAQTLDVLLPLCLAGHLHPLRRRLDELPIGT